MRIEKLENFGCYVLVDESVLCAAPILDPPSKDTPVSWGEVTAPQSQEFLDTVNSLFGTNFKMTDFAGR